jgi:heat shock protein HslJ
MPRAHSILFALAIAVLVGACGSGSDGSSATAPPLGGTSWALASIAGAAAQPGGTLAFSGGRVSGSTGCNTLIGTYTQAGEKLTIKVGATTMMACQPPFDAQEQAVRAALPKTATFTDADGTLTLLDGSGAALLTYTEAAEVSLVGPTWKVTTINNGKGAVSSVIAGSSVTATFGADGKVTGFAGCNSYGAGYTTSGTTIKVDQAMSTMKACDAPSGVTEQETAFLAALAASTVVEPDAAGITLLDSSGAIQLTLAAP